MPIQPRVSRAGIELVKRFEGLRRQAARLESGGWTIGYGHTRSAREGAEVTAEEAEALLIYDLRRVAEAVVASVYTPLNQNQFDALVAFAFNIGPENFAHSAVLKRLNEGNYLQAASAIELWRKAEFDGEDLVIDALVRRRAAEKALFLTPPDGFRPAPTPVLRVVYDPSILETLEQRRSSQIDPVVLNASLEGALATLERARPPLVLTPDEEDGAATAPTEDEENSVALAAAANVKARLEKLFADEDPAAEPAPPPLPDPRTDLALPPAPVAPAAEEEEAPPPPKLEPVVDEAPAEPTVEAPPASEPETASLFDPLAAHAPAEPEPEAAPEEAAQAEEPAAFGRRAKPVRYNAYPTSSPNPRRPRASYGVPMLVVAMIGAALFTGSIVAMLNGKAQFGMLGVGIVGIILMAPAGIRFLLNRLEDEAGSTPPE
jgi:lysozyme